MTATTAKTIPEAAVIVPPYVTTPVSGTHNQLCITEMSDGRIFCTYEEGLNVRGFIVASADQFSDSMIAASAGTILFTAVRHQWHQSCFNVAGTLYLLVKHNNNGQTRLDLYVADDSLNPLAGFTFMTNVDVRSGLRSNNTEGCCGVPMVLSSGRWVLPGAAAASTLEQNNPDHFGIFTSDDSGASFTKRFDRGYYLVGGSYMHYMCSQIGALPDGRLYGSARGHPLIEDTLVTSSDDGTTWSEVDLGITHWPVVNDGTNFYVATNTAVANAQVKIMDNTLAVGPALATLPVSTTGTPSFGGADFKALWFPLLGKLCYVSNNKVAFPSGGWLVGAVGIG